MSVSMQAGVVSLAMQSEKVGKGGTFTIGSNTWYRLRTTLADFGPGQQIIPFAPEVDGEMTVPGAYKVGNFWGGTISLLPRLEQTFGYLLKGVLGAVTTTADKDLSGADATDVNSHLFHFATDPSSLPWVALRKEVPGAGASSKDGQVGYDGRIAGMRLVIPNAGKLAAEFSFRGRANQFVDNPSWTYANTAEDSGSTPDVGAGHIKIGGTEYPFVGAEIAFDNALSGIEEEYVIGSVNPDNFIAKGPRVGTIRLRYKYEKRDLFRLAFTGAVDGTSWTTRPYATETDEDDEAFECYFTAPNVIGETTVQHAMKITAGKVVWDVQSIRLAPGMIGVQEITGFIVTPPSGAKAIAIGIQNGQASY